MRMQERVDIWNSFLMHKNLSFRVVTNKDLPTWWVFTHGCWLVWNKKLLLAYVLLLLTNRCFMMCVGQVHYIRKSSWCLGFWGCGSSQWHSITSRGLTAHWISCMSLGLVRFSMCIWLIMPLVELSQSFSCADNQAKTFLRHKNLCIWQDKEKRRETYAKASITERLYLERCQVLHYSDGTTSPIETRPMSSWS
jgi:hypothetical protein